MLTHGTQYPVPFGISYSVTFFLGIHSHGDQKIQIHSNPVKSIQIHSNPFIEWIEMDQTHQAATNLVCVSTPPVLYKKTDMSNQTVHFS